MLKPLLACLKKEINISLTEPPKESEVQKAFDSLSNDKAPGSDYIQGRRGSPCTEAHWLIPDYVGTRIYSARSQGCLHYPSLQEKRKQAIVWQPPRDLSSSHSWTILARWRVLLNRLLQKLEDGHWLSREPVRLYLRRVVGRLTYCLLPDNYRKSVTNRTEHWTEIST